jgi:aromatic ring-opening dioxygenase catalytic subunit (LigB family)
MKIGTALAPLRDEEILLLWSGYSFHNMNAFFNPSPKTVKASSDFNEWLKDTSNGGDEVGAKLQNWASAPGGRISHPREELMA